MLERTRSSAIKPPESSGIAPADAARRRAPIDVTVCGGRGARRRPGIVVHRSLTILNEEVTTRDGIPVTTAARTLLDLAAVLPRRQLERSVDQAERLKICSQGDLDKIVAEHFGRPGAGALGAVLREHQIGSTATRNAFGESFLALCRRYRLPQPGVNVPLLDYVVDFLWAACSLDRRAGRPGSHRHPASLPGRPRPGRPPRRGRLSRAALHLVGRHAPPCRGRRPRPPPALRGGLSSQPARTSALRLPGMRCSLTVGELPVI